jgi:hypothetical protein
MINMACRSSSGSPVWCFVDGFNLFTFFNPACGIAFRRRLYENADPSWFKTGTTYHFRKPRYALNTRPRISENGGLYRKRHVFSEADGLILALYLCGKMRKSLFQASGAALMPGNSANVTNQPSSHNSP